MSNSIRQKLIDKMILETDGGLAPAKKERLQQHYSALSDDQLVAAFYSHAWDGGYDSGYEDGRD